MTHVIDQTGWTLGLPKTYSPWLALWSPVLDCFLLVTDDMPNLQRIRALTTGKIMTTVVELDKVLSDHNTIDNSCVEKWTLLDQDIKNFCSELKSIQDRPVIREIRPVENQTNDQHCLAEWFRFVWRRMRDLENTDVNDSEIMADFVGSLWQRQPASNKKQQIYQILLLENNIDVAQKKIDLILNNYD